MTRNEQIIALRRDGVAPREIARRLKLSPNIVAGVLHRAGATNSASVQNRRQGIRNSATTPEFRAAVVAAAEHTPNYIVARNWGLHPTTVGAWINGKRGARP